MYKLYKFLDEWTWKNYAHLHFDFEEGTGWRGRLVRWIARQRLLHCFKEDGK